MCPQGEEIRFSHWCVESDQQASIPGYFINAYMSPAGVRISTGKE